MKNNVKLTSLCLGLASLALGQTTTAPIYTMSILAGIPTPNGLGDNGQSNFGIISSPQGIVLDKNGNVFVADNNDSRIRRIDAVTGVITTWSTTVGAVVGLAIDPQGNLWASSTSGSHEIFRLTTPATGIPATTCTLSETKGATGTCVMVHGGGATNTYGGDGQYAWSAWIDGPSQMAFDAAGDLFIAETTANRVRMVKNVNNCMYTAITTGNEQATNTCRITTIAGAGNGAATVTPQFGCQLRHHQHLALPPGRIRVGDGGPALSARVSGPLGVAVSPDGSTLYISDTGDQRIRVVDMNTGLIKSLIGNCTTTTTVGTVSGSSKGAPGVIPCPAGSFGTATATSVGIVSSAGRRQTLDKATSQRPWLPIPRQREQYVVVR